MNQTTNKIQVPGEVALVTGLILNACAVTMFLKSGFGISVVSGVPYVLSLMIPRFSLGTWVTIIQGSWLLLVMITLRRFRPGYLIAFVLAAFFGVLLNTCQHILSALPDTLPHHVIYFALGYCMMSTGIACMTRCKLPILPFDTVPREFVSVKDISIRTARTWFDVSNLFLVLILSITFLGRIEGIGLGSVFCALFMGTGAGFATRFVDRFLTIVPLIKWLEKLA